MILRLVSYSLWVMGGTPRPSDNHLVIQSTRVRLGTSAAHHYKLDTHLCTPACLSDLHSHTHTNTLTLTQTDTHSHTQTHTKVPQLRKQNTPYSPFKTVQINVQQMWNEFWCNYHVERNRLYFNDMHFNWPSESYFLSGDDKLVPVWWIRRSGELTGTTGHLWEPPPWILLNKWMYHQ